LQLFYALSRLKTPAIDTRQQGNTIKPS